MRDLADNERTHAPRRKSEGVKERTCGGSDLGMKSGGRQPATEVLDSDAENHEKSTDSETGKHANTSEELMDSELVGDCERDQHSEER